MVVDGIRLDHVRRCGDCGRKPEVVTGYKGLEGDGPFIISCDHGVPIKDQPDGHLRFAMSRSWSKTRAVANWRALWKRSTTPPPCGLAPASSEGDRE